MPFWKTGFSQMQATATALTACTCVKFNDMDTEEDTEGDTEEIRPYD